MPTYEHKCNKCGYEWDDFYKMSDPVPTICPSCNEEGFVKRLISAVPGRVVITGRGEMRQYLADEAAKAKKRARTDENYLANAIGEDKYHQSQLDKKIVNDNLKNL
jgi:putative FmdB family regulatory protein